MLLPSQQQLGVLGSGLQRLEYMVSDESNRVRQVQAANIEISTVAVFFEKAECGLRSMLGD